VNAYAPQPYALLQTSLDPTAPAGAFYRGQSHVLTELSDDTVEWLIARAHELPTPETMIHVHQVGGAAARGPRDDLMNSLRASAFVVNIVGCAMGAGDYPRLTDWVRSAGSAFGPETTHRAYVNFSDAVDVTRSGAYTNDQREQLLALKRDFDPTGVFV